MNPKRSLFSANQLQFKFNGNFVVNDSSDSDSNPEQKDRKLNNLEESKVEVSKLDEHKPDIQNNKRPKLELKQSNSEAKNANRNLLGVPPAVKVPMNRKKLANRRFQCKSLSESLDLFALKKFDSKEILKDLNKVHLVQKQPENKDQK